MKFVLTKGKDKGKVVFAKKVKASQSYRYLTRAFEKVDREYLSQVLIDLKSKIRK